jgi:magnesium-transporting ATPase (P-type)
MKQNAYQIEIPKILEELKTSDSWLSSSEAKSRYEKYWPNAIQSKDKNSALKILLEQFTSPLVIILIIAAVISGLIGEWVDAIIICGVVVLNALLWFFQEYKADKAIQSLKKGAFYLLELDERDADSDADIIAKEVQNKFELYQAKVKKYPPLIELVKPEEKALYDAWKDFFK